MLFKGRKQVLDHGVRDAQRIQQLHLFADWPGTYLGSCCSHVSISPASVLLLTHLVPFIFLVAATILALYRAICLLRKARSLHLLGATPTYHGIRRTSQRSTGRLGRSWNNIVQSILTKLHRIYMKWYARNESFKAFLWFDADS